MKAGRLIVTLQSGTKIMQGKTVLNEIYTVKKTVNRLEPTIGQMLTKAQLQRIIADDRNLTVEVT